MLYLLCPVLTLAQSGPSGAFGSDNGQQPYQPAVPAPTIVSPYGSPYYGYSGGASTAAGSAMNGMANMMSAAGQRNLSNSAAVMNLTQAQRSYIENRNMATNTYFQMRATNKAARAAERTPPPTMEQLARIAKDGAPKLMSHSEMDHVNGRLKWPSALQQPDFEPQRREIDQLFEKLAKYGALDYADQTKVRHAVNEMSSKLKEQIRDIPPQDYVACRNFLRSTLYTATKTDL